MAKSSSRSRIATIAAGYADGIRGSFPRARPTEAARLHRRSGVSIVGRVSMDLITVDITSAVAEVRRGDWVELIGPDLPIERVAKRAGTIGYEILTRLGRRFHRDYVEGIE